MSSETKAQARCWVLKFRSHVQPSFRGPEPVAIMRQARVTARMLRTSQWTRASL